MRDNRVEMRLIYFKMKHRKVDLHNFIKLRINLHNYVASEHK